MIKESFATFTVKNNNVIAIPQIMRITGIKNVTLKAAKKIVGKKIT